MSPTDPIRSIEWLHAETLEANSYNPNVVFNIELRLLERSILLTGWVQPILIAKPDRMIIDGFHRRMLALTSQPLLARYNGFVPCAALDISRPQAMLMTIRMNRAKGTHVAVRMAAIVKELIDEHHIEPEAIAAEIGATAMEVATLYQDSIFKARNLSNYRYSKAWVPDVKAGTTRTAPAADEPSE